MSELIAIGYPQETTAQRARDEVNQLIQHPDTARAIIRNGEGSIWVAANPYGLAVRWAWPALTDIPYQGHRPGEDVHHGDHGTQATSRAPVVHS